MDPRPPKPSTQQPPARQAGGIGIRAASRFGQLVLERMNGRPGSPPDPLWKLRTRDERWICPYCGTAVARRPQRSLEDSAALHLDGCRSFNNGRGQPRPHDELYERLSFEELVAAAQADPSTWGVFDPDGSWWCPSCLCRQNQVRSRTGRMEPLVLQAAWRHLRTCPPYLDGVVRPATELARLRDLSGRVQQIQRWVGQQLAFEAWRYCRDEGAWICPCCLGAIPGISLRGDSWALAPAAIASHLITCPRFSLEAPPVAREEELRQAAGGPPMPYPGNTPTRVGTTTSRMALPVGSTPPAGSPQLGSGFTPLPTPLPGPAIPARVAHRSPLPFPFSTPAPTLPTASVAPAATPPAQEATASEPTVADLGWMDGLDNAPPSAASARLRMATPQDEEVDQARQLQESFMGDLPEVAGFNIAARFDACTGVSGDFYACVPLANGDLGLALGDVSGHGVQAGLVMTMARKALEIYARQGGSPAEVLAQVNDAIADDLGGRMFVTMVYGVLSPERRTITWVRAGHTPVLRFNPISGEMTEIKPRGMVVGMKSGPVFRQSLEEEVVRLEPGDMFLLYTDGIIEATNLQDEEFGYDRLAEVVRRFADEGPEAMVEQVMDRLRHFRGPRPRSDDTTLLALMVEP